MFRILGKQVRPKTTFPQNVYFTETDSVYLEYTINFESTGEFAVSVLKRQCWIDYE